jgi:hypothetical protein
MLVVARHIVQQKCLSMMKEQDPAEHVVMAEISDEVRITARVAHGDAEVMIVATLIIR